MSTQFKVLEKQIYPFNGEKIFGSYYQIPEYQRPYVWSKERVEELWEDVMMQFQEDKSKNYFLGSIVITTNADKQRYDIVDGQQRITTLTILFLVLRHFFDKESGKYQDLNTCIIDRKEEKIHFLQSALTQNTIDEIRKNSNKEELSNYFNTKTKSDFDSSPVLTNAKRFFELATESEKDLEGFTDYLLKNVSLLSIECQSENDALKIFETINAKGTPLSQVDILKGKFLQILQKLDKGRKDQFIEIWKEIIATLEECNFEYDQAFSSYYISQVGENLKINLHNSFTEKFFKKEDGKTEKSPEEVFQFSQEILKSVKDYKQKYIDVESDQYSNMLNYLPWGSYIDAIIFSIFKNVSDEKQSNLIKEISQFYFLHFIAGSNINDIKQTSFNIIKRINANKLSEIKEILSKNLAEKRVIENAKINLKEKNAYKEKWIKPLLIAIEYNKHDTINAFLPLESFHIEHILPQTLNKSYDDFTEEEHGQYVHNLGNLTLLGGKKNSRASNKPFNEKLEIYNGQKDGKMTNSTITRDIYEYNKNDPIWNKKKIEERTKDLISKASELLHVKLD
jgi:uncharacterized protein with ParB-like and HNH nuclease domain